MLSFILFTVFDALWHGGLLADFYGQRLLLLDPSTHGEVPGFSPFILFVEAINAVALSYFVLSHAPTGKPLADVAWIGALLGFTVSGSVNFLNHALLSHWDIVIALVDTAFGTIVGLVVALAIAFACGEKPKKGKGILGLMKWS